MWSRRAGEMRFLITDIVLIHRFESPPGWVSEEYARGRTRHGFVYVLEGEANYDVEGGASFVARAGDLIYMPQGARYTTRCLSGVAFGHMTVNFHMQGALPLATRTHPSNDRIRLIMTRLVSEWSHRHPYYAERCVGYLYELICAALREAAPEHANIRDKVKPAQDHLDEHFTEPFPKEGLAAMCRMSETYFRRLFRKVYGQTPTAYRTRLRIGMACDLLLSMQYTVEQIGAMCGFDDPAYFSRAFRKETGLSPSEYKDRNMDSPD